MKEIYLKGAEVFGIKTKVFLALFLVFFILTLVGAGYVLQQKGTVNAGYACVPMVLALAFAAACRNSKKK